VIITAFEIPVLAAVVLIVLILVQSIKVIREYERVVIFRMGRLVAAKGPGIFMIIPIVDSIVKVDLRIVTIDVPKQTIITRDNVTVDVDAVIYYRVVEPQNAITKVENFWVATSMLGQTTLRDIIGEIDLDDLLSKREDLNKKLQIVLDVATDPWGIKISAVTIRDVSLPESMMRAIAKQAEAERERRSRIILADGEFQASQKMTEAAELYQKVPISMRLRELQTLAEIAREKNMIVVTSGAPGGDLSNIAGLTGAFAKAERK
jgi:regulator of protease activity HflC (stomatin/prohibitin superfamily)